MMRSFAIAWTLVLSSSILLSQTPSPEPPSESPVTVDPETVDPETVDPETVDPETVDPDTPSGTPSDAPDPAVIEPPVGSPETVAQFFEKKFALAENAFAQGNFRLAWQLSEAILLLSPDVPFRADLHRLRREAQGRYLAKSVVVVSFRPSEDIVFPATELRGDVVIENHSLETITVGRAENDPVLGMAHFRVRGLADPGLGESAEEGTRLIRMPEEIRVDSGAEHRIAVSIPLQPMTSGELWMQRWMVGGKLRPITVRLGRGKLTRGIPWVPAQGVLLPEDLVDVPNAPLEHLRRALLTGERRRFSIASHLWWAEVKEEDPSKLADVREMVIDELLVGLNCPDGRLDGPVIRLLETLTGEVRERTARSWQIWGLTRRESRPSEEDR